MTSVEHIHFVTGKLAEPALRAIVGTLSQHCRFEYSIQTLPISVAALMTSKWMSKHLIIPPDATRVIVPGYLASDIEELRATFGSLVECGPKDLRDLPEFFGKPSLRGIDYGNYSIEIIAEINYANKRTWEELQQEAFRLKGCGADIIDLGCEPSRAWPDIGNTVRELVAMGLRISVDSFDENEVREATKAGATLVLSIHEGNLQKAKEWDAEVVVVPNDFGDYLASMERCVEYLDKHSVPYRLDPILEPIGCGFAASIDRYQRTRERFPNAKMMMGIGNLTELTDVDSSGVNVLLMGLCQEIGIQSVLTTEVIPWAQNSVRECDLARRLVHYSVTKKIPPKRLDEQLVVLGDPRRREHGKAYIDALSQGIRDNNYRLLVSEGQIHILAKDVHLVGDDPFLLLSQLMELPQSENVDPGHAFYLGFELSKAQLAIQLGKNYEQDQSLHWGHLTQEESHHRLARRRKGQNGTSSPSS